MTNLLATGYRLPARSVSLKNNFNAAGGAYLQGFGAGDCRGTFGTARTAVRNRTWRGQPAVPHQVSAGSVLLDSPELRLPLIDLDAELAGVSGVAFVLSQRTSLHAHGLWWAFPVANVTIAIVSGAIFARGDWKKRRLVTPQDEKEAEEEDVAEQVLI